jgi:glutathione synthase/RimK-type ligase-like ATP-grasp enzyme
MNKVMIVRRRKLGMTSCREIVKHLPDGSEVWRNDKPLPLENPAMVIRWGCTANVPSQNVVNTARAIHQVNDKLGFRRILNEHGLCPRTWFTFLEAGGYASDEEDSELPAPLVVRPERHSQGRNLDVCRTYRELRQAVNKHYVGSTSEYPYYISELINKVAEYRVFVVQGRVACVAQKTPGNPNDVAWNVSQGGRFDNVRWQEWDMEAVRTAVAAFNLTELDFGGVDVMVDGDGRAYVLEINSAPSLTSPYRQQCMGKCFSYIVENGKERMAVGSKYKKDLYYNYLHPAITEKAHVPT